jgi:hypothetical protein
MIEIYDPNTLARFRAGTTNAALRSLVERLVTRAQAQGLEDYTCISILTREDQLSELAALLGTDPRAIAWDWRTDHGSFVELGLTVSDDGFAHIVLVERGGELAT